MAMYSKDAGDLAQEYRTALSEQTEAIRTLAAAIKHPLVGSSSLAVMRTLELHEQRVSELKRKLEPFRMDKG